MNAGTYARKYGGGKAVTSGGGEIPYKASAGFDAYGSDGDTFASCGGAITTTFTWTPAYAGEPAPTQVVVDEWCVAEHQWDDGSCDNALGDPEVAATKRSGGTVQSPIHHYRVLAPGSDGKVTLTRTPTAVAGAFSAYYYGSCSVYYHAIIAPVTLSLAGVKADSESNGSDDILVGQGVTGTLSTGGYPILSTSYSWSVGGGKFASWVVSSDQETGTSYPVPSSEWSKAHPHWYWRQDQNAIQVSCSATIVTPDGVSRPVSASKSVDVWPPYFSFSNLTDSRSSIQYLGGPEPMPKQSTIVQAWFLDTSVYPSETHYGETFIGAVVTPTPFGPNGGTWNFLQIAMPSRTHNGPSGTRSDFGTGNIGLDNGWPYDAVPTGETLPTWGAPSSGASLPQARHRAIDAPGTGNLSSETSYSIGDAFEMSLMFRPPGPDSQYVRLHKFQWGWSGGDSRTSAMSYWTDPPSCVVFNISSAFETTHPTWQQRLTNTRG